MNTRSLRWMKSGARWRRDDGILLFDKGHECSPRFLRVRIMSTDTGKMFRTPSLDRERAFSIVSEIGLALASDSLEIRYSQTEGVFVFLPERETPIIITHKDFEQVLKIFEEDPWASKLDRLRKSPVNVEQYEAIIREAIADYFPEFEDL